MRGALRPTPLPLPPRVPGAYLALQLPQRLRPGPAARPRRRFLLGEREARCEVSSARRRRRRLLLRGRSGGGESRLAARISHRCPPARPARRPPPAPHLRLRVRPLRLRLLQAQLGSGAGLHRGCGEARDFRSSVPSLRSETQDAPKGFPPHTSAPSGSAGKRSGASTSSREKQLRKHPGPQISSRVAGMRGAASALPGGQARLGRFCEGKRQESRKGPREGAGGGRAGYLRLPRFPRLQVIRPEPQDFLFFY